MIATAAAVLSGCGGGQSDSPTTPTVEPGAAVVTDQDRQILNSPLEGVSDLVNELLADGVLTLAEYERGILEYKQCMARLGATAHDEWMPTDNHGYQAGFRSPAPPPEEDTHEARAKHVEEVAKCSRGIAAPLGYVWNRDHEPTERERQEARDAFAACLRAAGEDFPQEHPSMDEFAAWRRRWGEVRNLPQTFRTCQARIEREFDLPNFAGGDTSISFN